MPQICPKWPANGRQGHCNDKKTPMAGTALKTPRNHLIAEYRAQAELCRLDMKRTQLLERRFELQAKAEHLEQLADELARL